MIEYLVLSDEIKSQLNIRNSHLIIVKQGADVIGLGKINLDKKDISLYIEKKHQGNGYGRSLFLELIKKSKDMDLKEVYLNCLTDNYKIKKIIADFGGVHISTNNGYARYIISLK